MITRKKLGIAGAAVATVLTAGVLTAAALPAVAETIAPTDSTAAAPPTTGRGSPDPSRGGHQANGMTEELLTGDIATQVTDAVLAQYPDATIQRVETDAEGAAYEAHILQADGTPATVKLDESFAVTGLEAGGPGAGPHGGHAPDGDAPAGSGS